MGGGGGKGEGGGGGKGEGGAGGEGGGEGLGEGGGGGLLLATVLVAVTMTAELVVLFCRLRLPDVGMMPAWLMLRLMASMAEPCGIVIHDRVKEWVQGHEGGSSGWGGPVVNY